MREGLGLDFKFHKSMEKEGPTPSATKQARKRKRGRDASADDDLPAVKKLGKPKRYVMR